MEEAGPAAAGRCPPFPGCAGTRGIFVPLTCFYTAMCLPKSYFKILMMFLKRTLYSIISGIHYCGGSRASSLDYSRQFLCIVSPRETPQLRVRQLHHPSGLPQSTNGRYHCNNNKLSQDGGISSSRLFASVPVDRFSKIQIRHNQYILQSSTKPSELLSKL